MNGPTYDNFLYAARNILEALENIGEPHCCLVGGMAVRLWGIRRDVKDLDILVLFPTMDQLSIQKALVRGYPKDFSLQRPKDRNATFKKLFYRIPRTPHRIKIDLLLSNEPNLETPASLRSSHFEYLNQIPIAPLHFVLYHKLMGWEIRANSDDAWKQDKANDTDYHDIIDLCDVIFQQGLKPRSKSHMGRVYLENLEFRADSFVGTYGRKARNRFRKIGFAV